MLNDADQLTPVLRALADPTRRAIVARLSRSDASVGDLAAPFDVSLPAISRHLRVLEDAGVIERERRGRERYCRLRVEPLDAVERFVVDTRADWNARLDRLDAHLRQSTGSGDGR